MTALTSRLARLLGWRGYVPAAICFAAALILHAMFSWIFGPKSVTIFFVYLIAMLFSAWCGYGPGIAGVLFSAVILPYFNRPNFSIRDVHIGGVTVLILASVIVSTTAASRRRAEQQLRKMNEELDRRVREKTEELNRANAALSSQLAELETLYSELPVGLCFLDRNLRFLRVNETLARLNGLSAPGHIGKRLEDVIGGPVGAELACLYRNVIATGEPLLDYEVHGPSPSDAAVEGYWAVNCSAVHTPDRAIVGLQVIIQDIAERKRNERHLTQLNTDLLRANEDLEQFAYSASHDLQEPLRVVAVYSQMLKRKFGGQLGAIGDQYITFTSQAALRMEQLVRGLLAFTQASTLNPNPPGIVSGNEALQTALANLKTPIEESGALVTSTDLPEVVMHKIQLEQILQSLLGNALKYRACVEPRIKVFASRRDDDWQFSVQDNGIGIDTAYHDQIFGLFKRLHTAQEYSGTGIGLAICQRIVQRNGGKIWVESQLGEGSTFHFTVPHKAGTISRSVGTA